MGKSMQATDGPKNMKDVIQRKFLDDIIGDANKKATGWKVLVMDEESTRVISSILTMYDIMERNISLVERLSMKRQSFPDMDVIYLISPKIDSVRAMLGDFESRAKAKYRNVHLFFLDTVGIPAMNLIQANALFVSRIQTFKEIKLDFLILEKNIFHMDSKLTLKTFYGDTPDASHATEIARKLATLCISLNEFPSIRYQTSSSFARDIAMVFNDMMVEFKGRNPSFVANGDDRDATRDRAMLLICDRTFDTVTPLMHEYTYQAIANDLLQINEGVVHYTVTEGKGNVVTKEAILNDHDELWTDLKYKHIAQVSKLIADRMKDIVQNNATAGVAKKTGGGADVSIEAMSAIVKELPQFKHQMAKLGQHVNLSSQCMTIFGRNNLMNVSQLEQTMSTGLDEEGKEFKGTKLVQLLLENLEDQSMSKIDKIRLLAIFLMTQKSVSGTDRQSLIQTARLSGPEQQILLNFDRLGQMMQAAKGPGSSGVFGGMFKSGGGTPAKPARTAAAEDDGNIDTRHVCEIKTVLEAMVNGTLPADKWTAAGPAPPVSGESKVASVRTRKFGNAGAGVHYSGGRVIAFIAGAVSYSELRVANELEGSLKKEVILGGSCVVSPKEYIRCVAAMNPSSERADILNDSSVTATDGGSQRV